MVEYGYRYLDPDIGVFWSRFSPEQLKKNDHLRGEEVAQILDRYIRGEGYGSFQKACSVPRDAYAGVGTDHKRMGWGGIDLIWISDYLSACIERDAGLPPVRLKIWHLFQDFHPINPVKNQQ